MAVRKRRWITRLGEAKEAWIVDYRVNGSRHIEQFIRKKDADAREAQVSVDIGKGIHIAPSKSPTVAQAGAKWLDSSDKLEASTVESYRQHLRDHIVPFIGDLKLGHITVPVVRNFMDKLKTEGRSPAMIRRVVSDLGSILSDSQERGEIAHNAVRSLSKRRKKGAGERRGQKLKVGVDIPTPDEIGAIIASLTGRWRPLLLTAIFTGLRSSELRGLRWADVDLKKSALHVRQRADKFNKIGAPKSESGERTVPLSPILVDTLREWKLACPKGEADLVFPNGNGGIENHANIVQRGLAPALVAAGVTTKSGEAKYTGLHALRHFYASWCINRPEDGGLGLPLKMVQQRMGHATLAMTSDSYGHLFPSGDNGHEMMAAEKLLFSYKPQKKSGQHTGNISKIHQLKQR
jgi:integrase